MAPLGGGSFFAQLKARLRGGSGFLGHLVKSWGRLWGRSPRRRRLNGSAALCLQTWRLPSPDSNPRERLAWRHGGMAAIGCEGSGRAATRYEGGRVGQDTRPPGRFFFPKFLAHFPTSKNVLDLHPIPPYPALGKVRVPKAGETRKVQMSAQASHARRK